MKKLTNEQVIERLKKYYDDLDYSKVNYINSRTPITLICPKHGEFQQYANNALQGKGGCPKCKLTLSDKNIFIQKAKEIHGNKYDYSKVDFINGSNKVTIICPIHGEFQQVARHHAVDGNGCPKCGIDSRSQKKKLTLEQFIEKANLVHKGKYTYNKTIYNSSSEKIIITCPIHGNFEMRPDNHLQGQGCPKCGLISASNSNKLSLEEFINKAKEIHHNKYNYSNVKYRSTDEKVCIICPKHGEFWQTPHSHLRGSGCPKCGIESTRIKNMYSREEFIQKANLVHNKLYNYNKVDYNGLNNKVIINCSIHGDFEQIAKDHLKGCGCPKCAFSKGERYISNCLDSMNIKYQTQKEIKVDYIVRNSNYFKVDFYIELNNKKYIIEYNGIQHYQYIPYLYKGNKLNFQKQLDRDNKLREYCKSHNIKLLEIKYDIPFENINNLIKEFIYEKKT